MKPESTAMFLLIACAFSSAQARGTHQPANVLPPVIIRQIDNLFSDAVLQRAVPGASLAIEYDDGKSFSRHYGKSRLQPGVPVSGQTRFRIGSISKLVTATGIMKLVEDGQLDLDAPAASVLPASFAGAKLGPQITVRRLLNHTSGIPDFTEEDLNAKITSGVMTDAALFRVLQRSQAFKPGEDWAYSNAAFRVLSRILEHVSKVTFDRYIEDRLAPALGLKSLTLCDLEGINQAKGYVSAKAQLLPERAYEIQGLLGEGGLCSTAHDLALLPGALKAGKWIKPSTLGEMVAPTRLRGGVLIDWGLGVRRGLLGRSIAWGHTGGGPSGSWASVAHYPDRRVTVAVTVNGTGSDTDAATLQAAVATILFAEAPTRAEVLRPDLAHSLAGAYRHGEQSVCMVPLKAGLEKRNSAGTTVPLNYHLGTTFGRSDYPLDRIVFQIEDGQSVGYRAYYDAFFAEFWRKDPNRPCGGLENE